jgi:lipoate-protein ligase A
MDRVRALLVRESSPRPPALEVAVSHALVERASAGAIGPVLRIYRPAPTLAFGRLDALRPGFAAAAAAARERGFEPVVRAPGGHAVAYHDGCIVVDEVIPDGDPIAGMQKRFAASGERLAAALRTLGVDARVGRIPGEFCPGDFTVSARGRVKLVGTAQRVIRHASLLAASVAVNGGAELRAVLADVYAALELEWDPATAGAIVDEVPVTFEDVERAVISAYEWDLAEAGVDPETLALAETLEVRHAVEARTPRDRGGESRLRLYGQQT